MAPRKLQLSYLLNKVPAESDSSLDDSDSQLPSQSLIPPLPPVPGTYGSGRGRGSAGPGYSSSRGRGGGGASSSRTASLSQPCQNDAKPTITHSFDQRYPPVAPATSVRHGGDFKKRKVPPYSRQHSMPSMNSPPFQPSGTSAAQGSASQEKTNQCDLCPRAFKTKSDLTKHFRVVHLRERNFPCHLCEARFAERGYVDVLTS